MPSVSKKAQKPDSKSYKSQLETNLSSSSHSSLMEPPDSLFPSKEELLRVIAVLAIASSVVFTCNFIATYFNSTTKPFCDTNTDSLDSFSDCKPCPRNGECTQGKLECAHGYRKHRNICIEDGDVNERAKKLSELVENRLCEAYAQFLCHGSGTIWVQEDVIWNDLDGHQLIENFSPLSMYTYTKKRAMVVIDNLLEIRMNHDGKKELKYPDMVAEHYKPFTCHISQWISKHAVFIAPLCALVIDVLWTGFLCFSLGTRC